MSEAKIDEFPCIFPASREFPGFRDGFAPDCLLQRGVCKTIGSSDCRLGRLRELAGGAGGAPEMVLGLSREFSDRSVERVVVVMKDGAAREAPLAAVLFDQLAGVAAGRKATVVAVLRNEH